MSNTIRYDSLLARHLALELHALCARQRVQGIYFDRAIQALFLHLETGTLRWSVGAGPAFSNGAESSGSALTTARKPHVESVTALPDERVMRIVISGGARDNAATSLIVELLPPQTNVIALDAHGRVLKVLLPGGAREHKRGQPYQPPPSLERAGIEHPVDHDEWLALLREARDEEWQRTLIARVAYTSPINAAAILTGNRADPVDLGAAYRRYHELMTASARPSLIPAPNQDWQPYGHALWGEARACETLLAAFQASLTSEPITAALQRLEHSLERERRKHTRLSAEQSEALETAHRLRADADLLLAQAHKLGRGTRVIEVLDFQGQPRRLELDPALTSAANAQAWYEEARKRERASEKLPAILDASRRLISDLEARLRRARAGEVVELPAAPVKSQLQKSEPRVPYQRFRTSGGLEVRVGRNRRDNDELTLRHCAPNDIWMHARSVGGAHVVLRWMDAEANPPRRDLEQAAMLAALHSKARHSGVVPVDWTRRKYVRKPRRAPEGSVSVERVKTLFVRPDEEILNELRWTDST